MDEVPPLSDQATFFLDAPLYAPYQLAIAPPPSPPLFDGSREDDAKHAHDARVAETIRAFVWKREPLDTYCSDCDAVSVFQKGGGRDNPLCFSNMWPIEFYCARDTRHALTFIVAIDPHTGVAMKVGQRPSVADLAGADLKRFRGTLGRDLYAEFSRAVGLNAHGVGVGSFVYLRRIFERLIDGAHDEAKASPGWSEETYQREHRLLDRIPLLARFLPAYIVENRKVYSILSKHLHELTEEEALAHFPIVRLGIERILEAKIHHEREKKLDAQTALALNALHAKLKSGDNSPS